MREVRAHRRSKKLKQIIEPAIQEEEDEDEDEEPESYDYDNLHLANKFEDLQICFNLNFMQFKFETMLRLFIYV